MASKKGKAAPDDELDNLFDGLDVAPKAKASAKGAATKKADAAQKKSEQDLLAELENLGTDAAPSSRPHTPRLPVNANTNKGSPATKRASIEIPQSSSARSSEEKSAAARKSGESTRSLHTSFTPSATGSDLLEAEKKEPIAQPAASSGGSWWGGFVATATAAVKQAEAAVKEIQQNEEAKRWAEQVKGNVGALRGLGKHAHIESMSSSV